LIALNKGNKNDSYLDMFLNGIYISAKKDQDKECVI